MDVLNKISITQNEFNVLEQIIKLTINNNPNIELIDGYIKISHGYNTTKILYKTLNQNLYFLEDNNIKYFDNLDNIITKIDFDKTDYDYMLMFIHLSSIEKEYKIGNLNNGVIDIVHLLNNSIGYIYNTKSGYKFLQYDGLIKLVCK